MANPWTPQSLFSVHRSPLKIVHLRRMMTAAWETWESISQTKYTELIILILILFCIFRTRNHVRETQAGKTFLGILQRSHDIIRTTGHNISNSIVDIKTKRNSLRIALENLIIEYLRELTPHEEIYTTRHRRSPNDMPKTDDVEKRIEFGATNINLFTNTACNKKYKRVSQLDQIELDNAFVKDSENVHNIRRMLMYR